MLLVGQTRKQTLALAPRVIVTLVIELLMGL